MSTAQIFFFGWRDKMWGGGGDNSSSDRDYVLLRTLCIIHGIPFLLCKCVTAFQLGIHQPGGGGTKYFKIYF